MVSISTKKVVFVSIIVRFVSALIQKTWFVPDEHWQSVEVAHNFVFGYGHLTWEWRVGIRSFLYPLTISFWYKILQVIQCDSVYMLTVVPRMYHAGLAVICDVFTYWLAREEFGPAASNWAVFFNLSSWFMFYCMSRTLINSLETVLTTVSIYYFIRWHHQQNFRKWPVKFVIFAAISFMVRPTAAILLFPLVLCQISLSRNHLFKLQQCYFILGLFVVLLTVIIDRICFGSWVIVPYNFLRFNLVHGLGTFYGSHPWYWYLTHGLPTVLGTHIFPVALGVFTMKKHFLSIVIVWTLFVYSLLGHKEFRFILPLLPIAMCLAGNYCSTRIRKHYRFIIATIVFTNVFPAVYISVWHQRGSIDVMRYLATEIDKVGARNIDILFLMPCHSTPYYSHIHKNVSMRFLSCEPRLDDQLVTDEADLFYANPDEWLSSYSREKLPSHVVMFDQLQPKLSKFVSRWKFKECSRIFHAHFSEGRVGNKILVFCKNMKINKSDE